MDSQPPGRFMPAFGLVIVRSAPVAAEPPVVQSVPLAALGSADSDASADAVAVAVADSSGEADSEGGAEVGEGLAVWLATADPDAPPQPAIPNRRIASITMLIGRSLPGADMHGSLLDWNPPEHPVETRRVSSLALGRQPTVEDLQGLLPGRALGAVRASVGIATTERDISRFVGFLEDLAE